MSVEITFEQDGGTGLVAEGISLWEAARRLGVGLRADCNGRGECDACAVMIIKGAELLSPASECEQKILGTERLGEIQRLACQTKLEKTGEIIVRAAAIAVSDQKRDSGKASGALPFSQQVGAFIETQATTITEGMNTLRGKSNALVAKFLNLRSKDTGAAQSVDGKRKTPAGNKRTGDPQDGDGKTADA